MPEISINLVLNQDDAEALAQFAKRSYYSDYREKASSDEQAAAISNGMYRLEQALKQAGFDPR